MSAKKHNSLVIVAPRAPYEVHQVPTIPPTGDEVMVNVKWTASTPLDLHQADGGLLIQPPQRTGSSSAGIVVEVGPDVKHLKVGDRVLGFAHQQPKWKAHQEYATAPEWVFGKVPDNLSMEEAITVPENLVTAFNTISVDLELPTPWPKPEGYVPPRANERILIWGAASSTGHYLVQLLKFYGYNHLIVTASPRHHEFLKQFGAKECFDYRSPTVVEDLLKTYRQGDAPAFTMIADCIGSQAGSVEPISKIASSGTTVAILLPVIVKHATEEEAPEYSMDANTSAKWIDGVTVHGGRTFFYWRNELFKEKLQLEIIPELLAAGHIRPNRFRVVEGRSLLERATKALNLLRKGVSGEKLVWRVSDE